MHVIYALLAAIISLALALFLGLVGIGVYSVKQGNPENPIKGGIKYGYLLTAIALFIITVVAVLWAVGKRP